MADYNSAQVSLSVGGVQISGFGESTMVSVEWDTDLVTDKIGVDGEVTASKSQDLRATASITLMETSPSNAILAGFMNARRLGDNSIGVVPFMMEDGITGERIFSANAWVMRAPSTEKGSEASEREWSIRLEKAEYLHTGGVL